MRYLLKATTENVITTTEANDLEFIITIFSDYYNSNNHYDKIEVVDNLSGELLAFFYEQGGNIEFWWNLGDYTIPHITF